MPKGNNSYFGVALGQAIASGAGHISNALQRKYEMQRQMELQDRQMRQQDIGTQAQLASKGIRYDPTQPLDPSIFDPLISQAQEQANLARRKDEADIAMTEAQSRMFAGGQGGAQVITDPTTGVQYLSYGSKYGPRYQMVPPQPIAINPNTGEQVSMPRGAKIVEPSGAKDAKVTLSKVQGFTNALDEFEQILSKVPAGRIMGGLARLSSKVTGYPAEVRTAESLGGLMVPMATRIIGGDVGNLSETEQKAANRALMLANGTIEERKQSITLLRKLLQDKKIAAEKIISGGGNMWGRSGTAEGKGVGEQQGREENRIQVRRKDGKTGTINEADFDPAKYERI